MLGTYPTVTERAAMSAGLRAEEERLATAFAAPADRPNRDTFSGLRAVPEAGLVNS